MRSLRKKKKARRDDFTYEDMTVYILSVLKCLLEPLDFLCLIQTLLLLQCKYRGLEIESF